MKGPQQFEYGSKGCLSHKSIVGKNLKCQRERKEIIHNDKNKKHKLDECIRVIKEK